MSLISNPLPSYLSLLQNSGVQRADRGLHPTHHTDRSKTSVSLRLDVSQALLTSNSPTTTTVWSVCIYTPGMYEGMPGACVYTPGMGSGRKAPFALPIKSSPCHVHSLVLAKRRRTTARCVGGNTRCCQHLVATLLCTPAVTCDLGVPPSAVTCDSCVPPLLRSGTPGISPAMRSRGTLPPSLLLPSFLTCEWDQP